MSKKWRLVVVLLLVLLALLIAGDGGDAAPPSVEHEGVMWLVERGWLRQRLWPTAVEPVDDEFDVLRVPQGWLRSLLLVALGTTSSTQLPFAVPRWWWLRVLLALPGAMLHHLRARMG